MIAQPSTPVRDWEQWQHDIVALLKSDFGDALQIISIDDVDWPSWQELYAQGRSPRAAIERALERDL
jgi:hypothetical protein